MALSAGGLLLEVELDLVRLRTVDWISISLVDHADEKHADSHDDPSRVIGLRWPHVSSWCMLVYYDV